MNDQRPDAFMMIGLHKLAAQNGDGLVPELYELLTRRARMQEDYPNVTEFPTWETRAPVQNVAPGTEGLEGGNDNVIAFPARARLGRQKDSA